MIGLAVRAAVLYCLVCDCESDDLDEVGACPECAPADMDRRNDWHTADEHEESSLADDAADEGEDDGFDVEESDDEGEPF